MTHQHVLRLFLRVCDLQSKQHDPHNDYPFPHNHLRDFLRLSLYIFAPHGETVSYSVVEG
jgi:hypothetical protein